MNKKNLIIDELTNLEETNALIGFIQTAFAEGKSASDDQETASALYHIYAIQTETLKRLKQMLKES